MRLWESVEEGTIIDIHEVVLAALHLFLTQRSTGKAQKLQIPPIAKATFEGLQLCLEIDSNEVLQKEI